MYNYLKGIVTEVTGEITVECGGVGYLVVPTYSLFASVTLGQSATIHVHHDVKENSQTLYGFRSASERELFRKLLTVNGVGPKGAIALLSIGDEKLVSAILTQDVQALSRIKGVSTKSAEKVILDLRSKLTKVSSSGLDFLQPTENSAVVDAILGLVNLGVSKPMATDMIARIKTDGLTAEEIIVEALNAKGRAN